MRIQKYRNDTLNDFEQEESLKKVAEVFAKIDRSYIRRIDGLKNIDDVHQAIMVQVEDMLRKKK